MIGGLVSISLAVRMGVGETRVSVSSEVRGGTKEEICDAFSLPSVIADATMPISAFRLLRCSTILLRIQRDNNVLIYTAPPLREVHKSLFVTYGFDCCTHGAVTIYEI